MLWGGQSGGLEVRADRAGGIRLIGSFPYGQEAVLSDGGRDGRPMVEVIEPGAFAYRIGFPDSKNIHLLHGHTFDRPLASVREKTLVLRDTGKEVEIEALITPIILRAQYAQDAVAQVESGLATGISPGFRLPPERVMPRSKAEQIEAQKARTSDGRFGAIVRRVRSALLYEFSIVTRPAYHAAQIEARAWETHQDRQPYRGPAYHLNRWRV